MKLTARAGARRRSRKRGYSGSSGWHGSRTWWKGRCSARTARERPTVTHSKVDGNGTHSKVDGNGRR